MSQSRNWEAVAEVVEAAESKRVTVWEHKARIERVETPAGTYYKKSIPLYTYAERSEAFVRSAEESFNDRLLALQRGLGHASLEQLAAYSETRKTVITHELPGASLASLRPEQISAISPEHFANLFELFTSMDDRGLAPDTASTGNFTYDTGEGFRALDYTLRPSNVEPGYAANEFVGFLIELSDIRPEVSKPAAAQVAWRAVQARGMEWLMNEYETFNNPAIAMSDSHLVWAVGTLAEIA